MVDVHVKGAAEDLRARAERDTGVYCREILGYNYELDEKTGEKRLLGKGGIYPRGPHQKIVKLLDSDSKRKQVLCPRKARKTTLLIGKICQLICKRPNIRIFYSMRTKPLAKKTIGVVRRALRYGEKISDLWGEQYDKDLPWSDDGFIVATRTDAALRDFTLWPGSLERGVAGDRADWIILDDLVDWQNVRSPEQVDKQRTYLKLCFPLLEHGGVLLDVGTPYDEADVHHMIRDEMGDVFESLWLPTGMEMVYDGKSKPYLLGKSLWPHFSKRFLEHELATMGPKEFMANMNMECQSPEEQMFFREQFIPGVFDRSEMRFLAGYLVTDTACTGQDQNSYTVLAVVLLGADDTAYLADLRLGLWKPDQVVDEFLILVAEWRSKCRLVNQVFENVMLSQVYRSQIEEKARQLPVNLVGVPVGVGADRKDRLRRSLQIRFASHRFVVLDTVQRWVTIRGKQHLLWDPVGHQVKGGGDLPAGMLVDHFIRPNIKRKDIVDAIALIDAVDAQGRRVCPPSPLPHYRRSREPDTLDRATYWRRLPSGQRARWGDLASRARRARR